MRNASSLETLLASQSHRRTATLAPALESELHTLVPDIPPTPDLALAMRKITRAGSTRIAQAAFKLAMQRRKKVTAVHKANVLRVSDGLFLECVRVVAARYPQVAYEERIIDAMAALYAQKMNAIFLARLVDNNPFHLYLNKPIAKADLTGLKLRITPVYRDFFQALGATVVQTAPGEVYTALERGVVDGYGWPVSGIFDLGWEKVTKYRLEPAFYSVEVNVLVNLDSWKALTDAQRKVLSDAALWLEGLDTENAAVVASERDRQTKAGIQPIDFGPDESKKFLEKANEVAWQSVIKRAPETGAKLRQLAGN